MKKSILTLCFIIALATMADAAGRFGIIAEQNKGLGGFYTDDMFNAQVTYTSVSDDASPKTEASIIALAGNAKMALDSRTAVTAGVSYELHNSKNGSILNGNVVSLGSGAFELEDSNKIALSTGIEREVTSDIILTAQIDVYSIQTAKVKGGDTTKTTSLFNNGRVGVAYLF